MQEKQFQEKVLFSEKATNFLVGIAAAASIAAFGLMWNTYIDMQTMIERERITQQQNEEKHTEFLAFMKQGPRFTPATFETMNKADQIAIQSLADSNRATLGMVRALERDVIKLKQKVGLD